MLNLNVTPCNVNMHVAEHDTISMDIDKNVNSVYPDSYEGIYTVIPSREQQILRTGGLVADSNITIEPIPSNYGLITWNGSFIKVS